MEFSRISNVLLKVKKLREIKEKLLYLHRNIATYRTMYLELQIKEDIFPISSKNVGGNIFCSVIVVIFGLPITSASND